MKSGIADYSAELLPHLAEHCEIELIVDEGFRPGGDALSGPWRSGRCRGCWRAGRFDAVLYQLGNNRDYHASIYRSLIDHPGVVVLHEYVIHHLVRDLTLFAGDPAGVRARDALRLRQDGGGDGAAVRGDRGAARSLELSAVRAGGGRQPRRDRSQPVHPRPGARLAAAGADRDRSASSEPGGDAGGLRRRRRGARWASSRGSFAVATFGFLTASKRPGVLLRAFARLRREVPGGAAADRGRGLAALRLRARSSPRSCARGSRSPAGWSSTASFSICGRATWR